MKDQFLYETFIPAIIVVVIALLSAEFVGRSKHIGRGYSFFMMLGLIPGIIGLIFSPSAKKEPTKANLLYSVFGVFLVLAGLYGFYQGIDNFSFINFFALLSYFSSAFYCFELSKGNVLNKEPKYYFEGTNERKDTETKMKLESTVSNLADLKEKGILTNEEYNQKVEKLEVEKAEQDLKNSTEYKQLKSLLDSGVLTKEEFENKIEFINNKNKMLIESIGQYLSQKDLNIIKSNYNKSNKYSSKEIRNKLEEVLKIKTNLSDNELIELVINELENKNT